jgi:prolyl 4-hydroxylase
MDPHGMHVRARLSSTPGVTKIPTPLVDLFVIREFLTDEECEQLICLIDRDRKPSSLFSNNPDPGFRTSETCNLDRKDAFVREIEMRITRLLGLDPRHGEPLQGQRYEAGQLFKPHHDYLRTDLPYWERQKGLGGQRTWTAMAYLNVPDEGGATYFPEADLLIPPRKASLVAWHNLASDGNPNPATLHQGLPVLAGVKFIVTKWYRERPWGRPA